MSKSKVILVISSAQGERCTVDPEKYEKDLKILIQNGFPTLRRD